MVIKMSVAKSFCLIFDRNQKRCMHCACGVVIFLFYVCAMATCARNRVKNWEDLGRVDHIFNILCCKIGTR